MEDASGTDLDWFWRGWFFGTDPVDISLDTVRWFKPDKSNLAVTQLPATGFEPIHIIKNRRDTSMKFYTDIDTSLRDYYYYHRNADSIYNVQTRNLKANETADTVNEGKWINKNFYQLTFSNKGGMIMPLIIEWTYTDGTKEVERVPVRIWMHNEQQATKVFIKDKQVASISLDPNKETADINESNSMWPVKEMPSRFQLFSQPAAAGRGQSSVDNSMHRALQQKKPDQ
jgi:hypothetical protein